MHYAVERIDVDSDLKAEKSVLNSTENIFYIVSSVV